MLCLSLNERMSAGGAADPPTMSIEHDETSTGFLSRYCSRSFQIVGTPAPPVTFSASIIFASGSACRNRSGMTSVAPEIIAR